MKRFCLIRRSDGLTAVELIVSLAILLIVLALGYQTFNFVDKSFKEGEKQWIAQTELQKTADWLDDSLSNSFVMLIYNNTDTYTSETNFNTQDDYFYVYQAEDKKLYYRNAYEISPKLISEIPIDIRFETESNDPDNPTKSLEYSLSVENEYNDTKRYEIESNISFANMLRSAGVNLVNGSVETGTSLTGNMVKFLNNTDDLKSIEIRTNSCFIATAAFGNHYEMPVSIMRQFRDEYLLTSRAGTAFVEFYYRHSPPIAGFIEDKPVLKIIVCMLLLPLAAISFIFLVPQSLILMSYIMLPLFIWHKRKNKGLSRKIKPL